MSEKVLEVQNLNLTYTKGGPQVLFDISFQVMKDDFYAIIGPSGAGKSSLIRCINKLANPNSGEVNFKGEQLLNLKGQKLRNVRRRIGMIFQEFNLIDRMSVIDNVLTGRLGYMNTFTSLFRMFSKKDVGRAIEFIEKVGLKDFANKRVDQLSGGQRQRVGIARALMQEPEMLLVDEPTSSLDPKIAVEMMELIKKIADELKIPVLCNIHNIDLGFKYLTNAKKLYLKKIDFSIDKEKISFKKVKKYFSVDKFKKIKFEDSYKAYPIFILGMPRSGTSLLEQIISTHSKVYGAGELKIMPKIFYGSNWNENSNSEELFKFVRKEYLSKLQTFNTTKKFIIDKMPFNFFSVGFIFNSIPEAKVIHMSRNPMAVCWSNYKSNFFDNPGMDYAHKLESVAEYYTIYNEMMNFWRQKYPESLIEIDYDQFVLDYEKNSKLLIEKIGLSWEDEILKFYENDRVVETNSLLQVRSKVYKDSSQNWKKYEKHLIPIMEILKNNNIKF